MCRYFECLHTRRQVGHLRVTIVCVFVQEDQKSVAYMCRYFEYVHATRTQLNFIPWFVFCVWICKKISESRVCVCLTTECLYTGKQVFVCVTTLSFFIQIDNWSLRPYIWLSALSVFIQKNRRTILPVCVNIFSVFMLENMWRLYLCVRQLWTSSYGKTNVPDACLLCDYFWCLYTGR